MVRVVEETRWSADLVLGIVGTPMKPVPGQEATHDDTWIEATKNPQKMLDMDLGVEAPPTPHDADLRARAIQRIRLTKNDFKNYGYTDDCPKCIEMKAGNPFSVRSHTEMCKYRIYSEFEKHSDPKWHQVQAEIRMKDKHVAPPRDQIDASGPELSELLPDHFGTDPTGIETPKASRPSTPRNDSSREAQPPSPVPSYAPTSPGHGISDEDLADIVNTSERMEVEQDDVDPMQDYGPYDLDDPDEMVSTLIMAGATADQAQTYAAAVRGKPSSETPTFMEFYGRGSIPREANRARRCLNVKGIHALDLRTFRPDGDAWDFRLLKHRKTLAIWCGNSSRHGS